MRIREEQMAGDGDFAAFYEVNLERLVVQLFAVTGNLQDTEDVVQEAFARACSRWRRLRAYDLPAAWVRRVAVATALAVVVLVGGCSVDHGQPTSGGPSTASGPPATGRRPAQYTYYAQAASFTGPDAWRHAQRQAQQLAQQLRAKGLPATVYESHTEFPSHTLYFFVAVASGEYPTRNQAQAQVARLRRAGFADAKVVEISLPK